MTLQNSILEWATLLNHEGTLLHLHSSFFFVQKGWRILNFYTAIWLNLKASSTRAPFTLFILPPFLHIVIARKCTFQEGFSFGVFGFQQCNHEDSLETSECCFFSYWMDKPTTLGLLIMRPTRLQETTSHFLLLYFKSTQITKNNRKKWEGLRSAPWQLLDMDTVTVPMCVDALPARCIRMSYQ